MYSALNTYGVTIPEDSVKLEDAENVLKVGAGAGPHA